VYGHLQAASSRLEVKQRGNTTTDYSISQEQYANLADPAVRSAHFVLSVITIAGKTAGVSIYRDSWPDQLSRDISQQNFDSRPLLLDARHDLGLPSIYCTVSR